MRKVLSVLVCFAIIFSFAACAGKAEFAETENKAIVSDDGTEYTFVGIEGSAWCFGEREFISHVKGEKKSFFHLSLEIKTGMYSVGGSRDVLIRYFPDNEYAAMYVKSELLKSEISLDNCIEFIFAKELRSEYTEITGVQKGITDCEAFLNEIKNGQKAKDAGLYDLVRQPDGMYKNCYTYGYVCGAVQADLNLFIPLQVWSFDDKAYSIIIDGVEYVLPQKWVDKLINE
ncbi:MAG: hypothetical protein IJY16_08480 [Clostridia bacterium]|nr:hypothetical protein [Clostridia bacterium]